MRKFTSSGRRLKSLELKELREISSCPVFLSISVAASSSISRERSRIGRYSIPAWQKRQPRMQPLWISRTTRSCVTLMYGTNGFSG